MMTREENQNRISVPPYFWISIKHRRESLGIKSVKMAELLGLKPAQYINYERLNYGSIKVQLLEEIVKTLKTSVEEMMKPLELPKATFWDNVLIERTRQGLGTKEMGAALGITAQAYWQREQAKVEPSQEIAHSIAETLDVPIEDLRGRSTYIIESIPDNVKTFLWKNPEVLNDVIERIKIEYKIKTEEGY